MEWKGKKGGRDMKIGEGEGEEEGGKEEKGKEVKRRGKRRRKGKENGSRVD